jgi:hypothetical protein
MRQQAVAVSILALGLLGGCPRDNTQRINPVIELVDAMGAARAVVDFKDVQINTTATEALLVRNTGTSRLTVSAVMVTAPFALATPLPFEVAVGETLPLSLTFRPTEPDTQVTATVSITSDDATKPTVTVNVQGRGVRAVASAMPRELNFRDVYVSEDAGLSFVLTNAGGNPLVVQDAQLVDVGPEVMADLSALRTTIPGGGQVSTTVRFAPSMQGNIDGGLVLIFGNEVGSLRIPVTGKGVEATPRLCYRFDGEPTERCTSPGTELLTMDFGSLCDNVLFPQSDGGCGGLAPGQRSGRFYLRNEGNTPVGYTMSYAIGLGATCDAGSQYDFLFANQPDAGPVMWSEARANLPTSTLAPRPWETPATTVTFRPTSRCVEDSADQARITWTRQGEPPNTPNRRPTSLFLSLVGGSRLPRGVSQDIVISGTVPLAQEVLAVANRGSAPLTVNRVRLFQQSLLADGGRSATPDELCATSTSEDCQAFAWEVNPSGVLPVTLSAADGGVPTSRALGRLVFGPADGGVGVNPPQVGRVYRVFAVVDTSDPYQPQVTSQIQATRVR